MSTADRQPGAEILLRALKEQGVEVIFGYPGGAVLPIYDAIFNQNAIKHVLVRQEGGAVHAAEGYARSTGKVGVVLVTSGPGATNAVTGLADALMDSIPVVCLTGQVPTHLIGNDAFQEADTTGITRPATKHNYLVKRSEDLARVVHEAFYVARSGRPGSGGDRPAQGHPDRPRALHRSGGRPSQLSPAHRPEPRRYPPRGGDAETGEAADHLCRRRGDQFRAACFGSATRTDRRHRLPGHQHADGLGSCPASDPRFLGMLGMHGTYEANLAMHGCDVMLAIGARFDDRVTGRLNAFSQGSTKIHIDIDPSSLNKNVAVDIAIVADAGRAIDALLAAWKADATPVDAPALTAWWRQIDVWRDKKCLAYNQDMTPGAIIRPQYAIQRLYEITRARSRGHLHHHRGRPAPDVGRAILPFRSPQPLDDLRRTGHDGLRAAGGHGRADRASGRAGDRHRRRGLGADEHPGNGNAGAIPPAGESVHPQQRVHGDGPPVAGVAA